MRFLPHAAVLAFMVAALPAVPAAAQSAPLGFGRQVAADPDAGVERLAAAMSRQPRGSGHDRPDRHHRGSVRDAMRNGTTRDAYAWLDNK